MGEAMTHLDSQNLGTAPWPGWPPGHIPPLGGVGHYPEEMPGIARIVFEARGPREWHAELFPSPDPTAMPVGGGDGVNVAHALAAALEDHNWKRG